MPMIKKLRVTVDGNTYEVTVELPDDAAAPAVGLGPLTAPSAPASPPPPAIAVVRPAAPPTSIPPVIASPAPLAGDVPSPLAGRVTAVVVTVGQTVKEGDHLITLEAMKMNTFVFAPR